jgi:Ca2+-binding RTX toxin-like protein
VDVRLSTGASATTASAARGTILNVENLFGGSNNDILHGNDADNLLSGGGGDDLLRGGAGVDTFEGGDGYDRISFFERAHPRGVRGPADRQDPGRRVRQRGDADLHRGAGRRHPLRRHLPRQRRRQPAPLGAGDFVYGHGGDDSIGSGNALAYVDGGAGVDSLLPEHGAGGRDLRRREGVVVGPRRGPHRATTASAAPARW